MTHSQINQPTGEKMIGDILKIILALACVFAVFICVLDATSHTILRCSTETIREMEQIYCAEKGMVMTTDEVSNGGLFGGTHDVDYCSNEQGRTKIDLISNYFKKCSYDGAFDFITHFPERGESK